MSAKRHRSPTEAAGEPALPVRAAPLRCALMRPEPPPPQPRQCGVVLTRDFHRDGDFIGWWEAVVPWIDGRHPGGLQTRAALPSRNNEAVEAGLLDHWTSWPALAERR